MSAKYQNPQNERNPQHLGLYEIHCLKVEINRTDLWHMMRKCQCQWKHNLPSLKSPCYDVATTLPVELFTQRNFAADSFWQKMDFTGKNSKKIAFCATLWGHRGNVHGSSMARWKVRGRLPISANWTLFHQLSQLGRYERILVEIAVLERGWVTLSANFRGKGVDHQRLLVSEN